MGDNSPLIATDVPRPDVPLLLIKKLKALFAGSQGILVIICGSRTKHLTTQYFVVTTAGLSTTTLASQLDCKNSQSPPPKTPKKKKRTSPFHILHPQPVEILIPPPGTAETKIFRPIMIYCMPFDKIFNLGKERRRAHVPKNRVMNCVESRLRNFYVLAFAFCPPFDGALSRFRPAWDVRTWD